ncbi:MAG TPA: hypothetical protein VFH56_00295 [Acidimicrobiales bacterium]|nr:hypothetical protein [Acidimicrobiales bacterium]
MSGDTAPVLTEEERELLSALCEGEMIRPGEDGYCFKHYAPVKWEGHGNVSDVCCVDVEDYAEQLLALRASKGVAGG